MDDKKSFQSALGVFYRINQRVESLAMELIEAAFLYQDASEKARLALVFAQAGRMGWAAFTMWEAVRLASPLNIGFELEELVEEANVAESLGLAKDMVKAVDALMVALQQRVVFDAEYCVEKIKTMRSLRQQLRDARFSYQREGEQLAQKAQTAQGISGACVVAKPDLRFREKERKELAEGTPVAGSNGRDKGASEARKAAQAEMAAIAARTLASRKGGQQPEASQTEQAEVAQPEQVPVDEAALIAGLKFDPKRPNVGKAARQKAGVQLGISEAALLVRMGYTQPQAEQPASEPAQPEQQPEPQPKRQPKGDGDKMSRKERIAAEQARRAALATQQAA